MEIETFLMTVITIIAVIKSFTLTTFIGILIVIILLFFSALI